MRCWRPIRQRITHARGAAFRKFADQTKSDRLALAACIQTSRELVKPRRSAHADHAGIWWRLEA